MNQVSGHKLKGWTKGVFHLFIFILHFLRALFAYMATADHKDTEPGSEDTNADSALSKRIGMIDSVVALSDAARRKLAVIRKACKTYAVQTVAHHMEDEDFNDDTAIRFTARVQALKDLACQGYILPNAPACHPTEEDYAKDPAKLKSEFIEMLTTLMKDPDFSPEIAQEVQAAVAALEF